MSSPVDIILDTDMGNDIDDALALAMLHALESRGETRLLAVSVSKDNPFAAPYVDAVNTFYGRGRIPVGRVNNGVTPGAENGNFIEEVTGLKGPTGAPLFPRSQPEGQPYPWAAEVLRAQLAAAKDGSVVLVMIGFSTNLAHLFETGPDANSPLDGLALFAQKIRHVVMMAANFSPDVLARPTLENREYNIRCDIPSARAFIARCPRPIIFSGFEIGLSVPYPASAIAEDFGWCAAHPVVEAYHRYLPMPYDRASWDLTSILFAARPRGDYFGLSQPGTVSVNAQGIVRFCPTPQGQHRHLTLDNTQRARVYEAHRLLVAQPR